MKKFISRVQNLSQKAAELKQAIESVPPKIAGLGQTVAMTTSQLQQLRANVHSSLTDLKADNEDRLLEALREINENVEVFHNAGYELTGVDMELSPVHRLIVYLGKFEDVAHSMIRSLLSANQQRRTVHGLLTSLLQAEAVADRVELSQLSYRTLLVNVGPIPSIRLCWRAEEKEQIQSAPANVPALPPPLTAAALPTAPAATAAPLHSTFSSPGSFFERTTAPSPQPTSGPESAVAASTLDETPPAAPAAPAPESSSIDWRREALERLKKTPHVSKYSR